jgi:hypothetical protein
MDEDLPQLPDLARHIELHARRILSVPARRADAFEPALVE